MVYWKHPEVKLLESFQIFICTDWSSKAYGGKNGNQLDVLLKYTPFPLISNSKISCHYVTEARFGAIYLFIIVVLTHVFR